jgi:hypothetical protein
MSDVPWVIVGLTVALLLSTRPTRWTLLAAGLVLGAGAWLRTANIALWLAGPLAIVGFPAFRRHLGWHLLGLGTPVVLLLVWQWAMFGSPLTSGYGSSLTASDGHGSIVPMFSARYLVDPPPTVGIVEMNGWLNFNFLPNPVAYVLQLVGVDQYLAPMGWGLLGLYALVRWAREKDDWRAVVARFALAVLILTLAVYVPYYYQSARFLLLPSILLTIAASGLAVELIKRGVEALAEISRAVVTGRARIAPSVVQRGARGASHVVPPR